MTNVLLGLTKLLLRSVWNAKKVASAVRMEVRLVSYVLKVSC